MPRADGPFLRSMKQASYVDAITWIVSCLADALHYSHARGLIHMDIKPSNVLITMDVQPMLLDFHLARGPLLAGEPGALRLGGTPGWMSPEQEQAMAAISAGHPVPLTVDGRSDIFALGLLLGVALGAFDTARNGCGLRRATGVSLGLFEILKKCLARSAGNRYNDPATLAEDLRRELNDLPLKGVRNRSVRERFGKWRRRHPGVLAWVIVALLMSLAVASALAAWMVVCHQRLAHVRLFLEDGRSARAGGRFEEAIRALGRGLELAAALPAPESLKSSLRQELRLAERSRLADERRGLADRVRARHGSGRIKHDGHASERSLDLRVQDFWPNFYHGLCSFRLRLFEEAVADFQACLTIDPGSAVAEYNCALAYDALGRTEDALRSYTSAIELDSSLAQARLNRGILSYKIGRYADAVTDFEIGMKTGPDRELSGRFQLNLALAQLGLCDRESARSSAENAVALGCREAAALLDDLR
jgi:tetratricopeptide (TPR) repeat protein